MFSIAICDDQRAICSEIETIILDYQKSTLMEIQIEVFYSAKKLSIYMEHEHNFDLIFLDIEMKGFNGLDLGRKIREEMDNQITQIVYVSGKESYFKDLFEVRPMHFLSKPVEPDKVIKDVELAMKLANRLGGVFSYKKGPDTHKLPIKNIIYFQSVNREIKIVTITGEELFYGKLHEVFRQVTKYRFINIHKSYIINYEQVANFKYDEVVMSNSDCLPISQLKRKEVRGLQMKYESERFL
ncbi:LytR/AlgR family response regulator transcription factor [Acetobacterium bakii]|uniref:Stage 0 sporulation protein A homolog n=1 Tax=Acetobacterium bakii TaxID=52689 RepID=A0A0L6U4P5_9FIRM|nr:LytTR family DNA-binding domain-containing protein [Acetobacterium bakii]KNZ43473.1 LytTR family transcriptional regulator [Acetobacterium bakii]